MEYPFETAVVAVMAIAVDSSLPQPFGPGRNGRPSKNLLRYGQYPAVGTKGGAAPFVSQHVRLAR